MRVDGNKQQLARLVHGAVCYGASADEALRFSRGSVEVLRLVLALVNPFDEGTEVSWSEMIDVIERAIVMAEEA